MPGDKGFDVPDEKYQPAKLSDRKRDGQSEGSWDVMPDDNTYGNGKKFDRADKVTNPGSDYNDFGRGADKGNWSQKNSSISRLDLVNKQTNQCGTAYNSNPIKETYKSGTSNGVPDANAVEYETVKKDQNT
jgi:hypothetical protein